MAHLTSCPSLHAARVVLQQYALTVLPAAKIRDPKLEADERCVAIVIDYGTQIFHVIQLRPELRYWQQRMQSGTAEARDIAGFFQRMLTDFEKLPAHTAREEEDVLPLETGAMRDSAGNALAIQRPKHVISRPAMEASRLLYGYYDFSPRVKLPAGTEERAHVALLIDIASEVFRCVRLAPKVRTQQQLLLEGKLSADRVARFLRYVGLELEHLPNYENREEEVRILYSESKVAA